MAPRRHRIEQVSELFTQNRLVAVVRHVYEDVAAVFFDPVVARTMRAQIVADPVDHRIAEALMQQEPHLTSANMVDVRNAPIWPEVPTTISFLNITAM